MARYFRTLCALAFRRRTRRIAAPDLESASWLAAGGRTRWQGGWYAPCARAKAPRTSVVVVSVALHRPGSNQPRSWPRRGHLGGVAR